MDYGGNGGRKTDGEARARVEGRVGVVFNEVSLRPAAAPKC